MMNRTLLVAMKLLGAVLTGVALGVLFSFLGLGAFHPAEIEISTLFLVGEHDEARPETMLEFQALVPGSVVKVIPNAAHTSAW